MEKDGNSIICVSKTTCSSVICCSDSQGTKVDSNNPSKSKIVYDQDKNYLFYAGDKQHGKAVYRCLKEEWDKASSLSVSEMAFVAKSKIEKDVEDKVHVLIVGIEDDEPKIYLVTKDTHEEIFGGKAIGCGAKYLVDKNFSFSSPLDYDHAMHEVVRAANIAMELSNRCGGTRRILIINKYFDAVKYDLLKDEQMHFTPYNYDDH